MTSIERLIHQTGGCGMFQLLHVLSTYSCRIISVWGTTMMAFGNFNPGWSCPHLGTGQQLARVNSTLTTVNDTWSYSDQGEPHVSETTCSSIQNCSHLEFNSDGRTLVSEWNLVCDKDWIPSLIISLQMVGQLIGSTITGYISEYRGRKTALYSSSLIFVLTNLASAFSISWQMFAVLRIFVGIGIGGVFGISYVYALEFLNPKWRGIVGGLPLVNFGLAVFSLVVFLERDWRLIQFTIAGISFLTSLTFLWVSESIRWLTIHGKKDKAKGIVVKIARYNDTPIPDMGIIDLVANHEEKVTKGKKYAYKDLFHRKIRTITIKLLLLWFFEVTVYFCLTFSVKALPGDFYLNLFIFSVSEVPAVIITGPIMNSIGRVKSGAAYYCISTVACGMAVVVSMYGISEQYHFVIVIMTMTAKCAIAGGRSILRLSTGELMPTSVRAYSYNFNLLFSRIGGTLAPFLIPGSHLSFSVSLTIQTILLFLCFIIYLSLPESKDKEMSDVLEDMETENEQSVANAATKDLHSEGLDLSAGVSVKNEEKQVSTNSRDMKTKGNERKKLLSSHPKYVSQ